MAGRNSCLFSSIMNNVTLNDSEERPCKIWSATQSDLQKPFAGLMEEIEKANPTGIFKVKLFNKINNK